MDPLDYKVLGLYWDNGYYLDTGVPFGLIFGSFWCQKTTDAIRHIMQAHGYTIFNYSDDLISISKSLEEAQDAYRFLLALLDDLGLPVSANKLTPPTRCLTCLGIEFDIDQACIRIPQDKLDNIRDVSLGLTDLKLLSVNSNHCWGSCYTLVNV